MAEPLVSVEGASVSFGTLRALDGVDVEVAIGGITGLIGPNGAGKTTVFNLITGLVIPDRGTVRLAGRDITRWPPHRRARAGIVRTYQRIELFGRLSVAENLLAGWEASTAGAVWGRHAGQGRRRVAEVMEQLELGRLAGRPAGQLAPGQARIVELGRALCARARVLLLDEPGSGLDGADTQRLVTALERVAGSQDGEPAVLLVEHDMALVAKLCQQVTVLDFGRRIASGTPEQVRADPAVLAAYLGPPAGAKLGAGAPTSMGAA